MQYISTDDPLAIATVEAIRGGNLAALKRLLAENPSLATCRLGGSPAGSDGKTARTLLHVVADWPGHYPNGAETVAALVAAGADVNARLEGQHTETPLHWAASSDDVAVLDALLDHGADLEAPGAVIGGGTPIADAAAFGQWKAAQRLLERGAKTCLWEAASLGLMDRVQAYFACMPAPRESTDAARSDDIRAGAAGADGAQAEEVPADEVTRAFWCACHGGRQQVAEYLLQRGANINWIGYDKLTPLGAARRSGEQALVDWLVQRGAR